jgi:hypothetical protein
MIIEEVVERARSESLPDDPVPAKLALDSETSSRVTGAGAHTASICRHAPEVGAVCGKAARTDLCGGREVTRVPTAKDAVCCRA